MSAVNSSLDIAKRLVTASGAYRREQSVSTSAFRLSEAGAPEGRRVSTGGIGGVAPGGSGSSRSTRTPPGGT